MGLMIKIKRDNSQEFLVLYDDKGCRTRKTVGCFPAFFFSLGILNFVQGLKSERKEKLTH